MNELILVFGTLSICLLMTVCIGLLAGFAARKTSN